MPTTLGIVALNHLSHAHASRDELGDWYERLFGFETVYESGAQGVVRQHDGRLCEMVLGAVQRYSGHGD